MEIHVIDDNIEITRMLQKYLTIKGHKCTVSNDGRNGLAIIQNQKFDGIILDLGMPDFSGMDVVDHLSKTGKINDMNVVVLTASSPSDEYEKILRAKGIKAIFKKPLDPDTLLNYLLQLPKKQP